MGREEEGQGEGERFKWGHEEGQVGGGGMRGKEVEEEKGMRESDIVQRKVSKSEPHSQTSCQILFRSRGSIKQWRCSVKANFLHVAR